MKKVEEKLKDTFLVLNGDIFTDLDIRSAVEFHKQNSSKATIVLTPVEDPTPYGVVETNANGRIRRFVEKPRPEEITTMWINAGIYILEPEVLKYAPTGEQYMFERGLFPKLLANGIEMYGLKTRAYWIDMGTPQNYIKLHRDALLGGVTSLISCYGTSPGLWISNNECKIDNL